MILGRNRSFGGCAAIPDAFMEVMVKRTDFVEHKVLYGGDGQRGLGRGQEGAPDGDDVPMRSISDISITRMAKKKEEINAGVVSAIKEIEELKRRQEELEREKNDLEDLAKKQKEYDEGKREVIEHLTEGIVALEKKEIQSAQLTDLVVATRNRFKEILSDVERLSNGGWTEENFRQELFKSLVIIDDARMEYNKSLAKIQVLEGKGDQVVERISGPSGSTDGGHGFGYWFMVGFALAVPFGVVAAVFAAAYVVITRLLGI